MKTLRFMAIAVVSAIVAAVVTLVVDMLNVFPYEYAFVAVYCGSSIGVAALLGAFNEDADKRKTTNYESIKHRMGRKEAA